MRRVSLAGALLLLAGCSHPAPPALPEASPSAVATAAIPSVGTTTTPKPVQNGWQRVAPGVELRDLEVNLSGRQVAATVVRLDPAQVRLHIGYTPGQAQFLDRWASATPAALVTVNGGYFTPEATALGLVVVDGTTIGRTYRGFGGMLAATASGEVTIRALRSHPYQATERLQSAIQCYPMLVVDGAAPALPSDNREQARRTVVAATSSGRLLVITVTDPISLTETGAWLLGSGLEVSQALNLDGGGSTGMAVRSPAVRRTVPALSPLPLVVQVLPR